MRVVFNYLNREGIEISIDKRIQMDKDSNVIFKKAKKNFELTFIQIICAISVVTLHTNGCFWEFSATERYWYTANIIENVLYFAVPIFFMLTGITLIDYQDRYSTKEFFKKRAQKILLPYVVWSLLGVLFLLISNRLSISNLSAKWIFNSLLSTGGIIDLYWFFQPLFCTYLCIPLFAAIDKNKKKHTIKYLLFISLIINIIPPFLNSMLNFGFTWSYQVSVISGYLFYIVGGYYIQNYPPTKKTSTIMYVLGIIGLIMGIVGTYTLSIATGSIQYTYKGYNNLPCVLYSVGTFLFLKKRAQKIGKIRWIQKIVMFLGEYTFALYLIHWFVLRLIWDLTSINTKSIFYRLLAPYLIYTVVICITWILRRIPVIRKIVP